MDKIKNLKELGELLKSGAISQDEFNKLKDEVLNKKSAQENTNSNRDVFKEKKQNKNKIQPNDNIDEKIRVELLKYDRLFYVHCLPCGYNGPCGVLKRSDPWYVQWWFIILSFFFFIGWVMLFIKGFMYWGESGRWLVQCPNCKAQYLMEGRTY